MKMLKFHIFLCFFVVTIIQYYSEAFNCYVDDDFFKNRKLTAFVECESLYLNDKNWDNVENELKPSEERISNKDELKRQLRWNDMD